MVSPIKRYKSDPMNKGRGAGLYYKRSHSGTKSWYSKYSEDLDIMRKSGKAGTTNAAYRHTGDEGHYSKYPRRHKKL